MTVYIYNLIDQAEEVRKSIFNLLEEANKIYFVHLSAIWKNTALVHWIRCEPLCEHLVHRTFPSNIEQYSTYSMCIFNYTALVQWIRCSPKGEHLIHWTSAVFSHIARKMNTVCIFSHDQVTRGILSCHTSQLNLQLECGMGWYRYTVIGLYVS